MGLLVHTTFETTNGISVTNVYLRITSITVDFVGFSRIVVKCESHISREKRLEGKQALYVPGIPAYFTVHSPLDSGWNDIIFLYSNVKAQLLESGYETVEDVFEPPTPPSEPEPPAPLEPLPIA